MLQGDSVGCEGNCDLKDCGRTAGWDKELGEEEWCSWRRVGCWDLTSGSCNDRSMMVCECRSRGSDLRRHRAAETRLL